jgi:hypothetical protein
MFKKRILWIMILIIGIMFVGAVAIGFTACDTEDTGENSQYGWYSGGKSDSFTIKDYAQLEGFAKIVSGTAQWIDKDNITHYIEKSDFLGKTVTLANDINMSGKTSWGRIGYVFNGTFDGNNKTISGLPGDGFFSSIGENGIVKNIVFANVNLDYHYLDGGAVTYENRGKIQNISVDGSIGGGNGGGLVNGNKGTIENCTFSGNFSPRRTGGGIVGENEAGGIIRNCAFTGNITALGGGGIAGGNRGTVENCYSTGNLTGGNSGAVIDGTFGGIVEVNYATVRNCYSTSNTSGGGIAGVNVGNVIQNCYATGNVTGYARVGGIAGGGNSDSSVQNCAALNSSITETVTSSDWRAQNQSGRIVANFYGAISNLSNNYGKSGMPVQSTDNGITVTSDANGQHGADVQAQDYNTQSWWETTLNWDFNTVWRWDSAKNLPHLPEAGKK